MQGVRDWHSEAKAGKIIPSLRDLGRVGWLARISATDPLTHLCHLPLR